VRIERLRGTGLRNLLSFDLAPAARANWIVGDNGAGKTALLEGIYLIARGRSFRGRKQGQIVSHGASGCRLDAWIRHPARGLERGSWTEIVGAKSSAQTSAARTEEARDLPAVATREHEHGGLAVRLVGDAAQRLIDGDPALRRRFVDWNLLLIEGSFGATLTRFRRVQAQRNAWLRAGAAGPPIWDEEYADAAERIAAWRADYFTRLTSAFAEYTKQTDLLVDVRPFWHSETATRSILQALRDTLAGDRTRGFTFAGPARADFSFRCRDRTWVGSRGENKLAAIILQLAADRLHHEATGEHAVWLVDDLRAELGTSFYRRAQTVMLAEENRQVFFTSLYLPERDDAAVFHVEQGNIGVMP